MDDRLFQDFKVWTDRVLSEHGSTPAAAFCFNLYEHEDFFAVQLVGAAEYNHADPDWVCNEAFSSGEDLFEIPRSVSAPEWEDGLKAAKSLVVNYLRVGRLATRLLASDAVAAGFVDGDLEIISSADA